MLADGGSGAQRMTTYNSVAHWTQGHIEHRQGLLLGEAKCMCCTQLSWTALSYTWHGSPVSVASSQCSSEISVDHKTASTIFHTLRNRRVEREQRIDSSSGYGQSRDGRSVNILSSPSPSLNLRWGNLIVVTTRFKDWGTFIQVHCRCVDYHTFGALGWLFKFYLL